MLYVLLARYGYSVISDSSQYSDGIRLWKSIGRQQEIRDFFVRIWNVDLNDWVRNSEGGVVNYNGNNIQSTPVWKRVSEPGDNTVLVLTTG